MYRKPNNQLFLSGHRRGWDAGIIYLLVHTSFMTNKNIVKSLCFWQLNYISINLTKSWPLAAPIQGRPRADVKGLWRANIKFLRKGLYRADMKGQPRADIKGRPRADIKGMQRAGIKFLRKGLYRADMKGRPRADMKGRSRANFYFFF